MERVCKKLHTAVIINFLNFMASFGCEQRYFWKRFTTFPVSKSIGSKILKDSVTPRVSCATSLIYLLLVLIVVRPSKFITFAKRDTF